MVQPGGTDKMHRPLLGIGRDWIILDMSLNLLLAVYVFE